MSVYIEWVDMPGGSRHVTDGPFAFVAVTYNVIRVQSPNGEDDEIGEAHPSGGWVRFGDETEGFGPIPDQEAAEPTAGWYSDMVISTEAP